MVNYEAPLDSLPSTTIPSPLMKRVLLETQRLLRYLTSVLSGIRA